MAVLTPDEFLAVHFNEKPSRTMHSYRAFKAGDFDMLTLNLVFYCIASRNDNKIWARDLGIEKVTRYINSTD